MSEGQTENSKPYDPIESFRGMRDAYLDAMAKTMVEAVNTDAYAQATGAMLDTTLTMSAPFRDALEKTMLQVLQQLSLPSRQDVIGLAERFTNLEMRLDDMDASLDAIEPNLHKSLLPLLKQLVMLTETLTTLVKRMDALEVKVDRGTNTSRATKSTTAGTTARAAGSARTHSPARASAGTRAAAAKSVHAKKRTGRKAAK
jgi:hypothetical protein